MNARCPAVAVLAALTILLAAAPAHADSRNEFWPGLNAYVKLDSRWRVYLLNSYTFSRGSDQASAEQPYRDVTLGAHVDYTLEPIAKRLTKGDWERERYVWARVGYRYISTFGDVSDPDLERRILAEMTWRIAMPNAYWVVNRAHVDFRDVSGVNSQRYRYRLTLERETAMFGVKSTPWASAEFYYDTRYDDWTRQRYQAGIEFPISKSWRIEPYVSAQHDSRSSLERVNALGLDLKYYR